jgi:hypothetical protein
LRLYPQRRVKAYDGMAVTAETWDFAHDAHRRLLEVHTRFAHGPGILYGLEVFAGEPPGAQIYIQPGFAVDELGRTIIMPEQRGYDLRTIEGLIYLVLTYEESAPRNDGAQGEDAPRYVYSEYALQAMLALPETPHIELARFRRQSDAAVQNARDPDQPRLNEIDLRWRTSIGAQTPVLVRAAVVTLGATPDPGHKAGVANLARALRTAGAEQRMVVDFLPGLDRSLLGYDLLFLVGLEAVRLTREQVGALNDFMRGGGFIFYESCRSQSTGEPVADAAFMELMGAMGVAVHPLADGDPLLRMPNFFAMPPEGFETQGTPRLMIGNRVIFSTFDYGCIWNGRRRGRPAGRSEIRSALEFGHNLIAWVAEQKARVDERGVVV